VDFLGIGAQKSATTWLYERLAAHPAVAFPGGKELHFWDHREGRPAAAWLAPFAGGAPGVRQGEITPGYALLPDAVVAEIGALCPGLRIFMCLRNPMERAWSSALMALERAEMILEEASDAWFVDHFRSRGSLGRGDYEGTLRRWRRVFGEEAVLSILYEDVVRDPASVLATLARHIGVDPGFYTARPVCELAQRVFAGPGAPVRPSLRPVLREIYGERVASLGRYLGRDLSAWQRFDDEARG